MTYVISGILLFLNIIFTFIKTCGKRVALLLLLFMWLLYWSNTLNPDYYNYLRMYNSIQAGAPIFNELRSEFGYRILMKIATYFNFSFTVFLAVLTACSYLLIHSTVKKYCKNYNYVYSLYFIFPFFLDVVQIRNFVAMSIFIFAVRYLLKNSFKSKLKYIILILLASSIHYSAALYLPMILINVKRKNLLVRGIVLFSILGSIMILINDKQIPLIPSLISSIFPSDKILEWFRSKTNLGFLLFWFMQMLSFLVLYFTKSLIKKKNKFPNAKEEILFVELTYWINLLAFIYLPFYLLESTFTRLMRNIISLNYISFAIVNDNLRNKKILFNIIIVFYVLFFSVIELYIPYKDNVVNAILKYNLFMNR